MTVLKARKIRESQDDVVIPYREFAKVHAGKDWAVWARATELAGIDIMKEG